MFIAGILLTFVSCGDNGKSKKISIAYANWSEGIAMTNLAKAIFEDQGYDVKLLNADLAPIFTSISRKKADVFMDVWMPVTMEDYMKQYGDKLEVIGDIYDGARIGLVVPDYVTINSIEELNAEKERFSGQIVGIDAGAGIMKATDQPVPPAAAAFLPKLPKSSPAKVPFLPPSNLAFFHNYPAQTAQNKYVSYSSASRYF